MKKTLLLLSCLLQITILLAQDTESLKNKVMIIGIDGCRPDALQQANTPHLDALIANGTYSMDVLNNHITVSGPAWSAIMTGVWEEKHKVVDNLFTDSKIEDYPPFFKYIEDYDSTLHTASISQWFMIYYKISRGFVDSNIFVLDETKHVTEATVEYLSNRDPDALFIHFDDVDHAGHANGFAPDIPEYMEAIEKVDAGIGEIMSTLEARPNRAEENWLIIVTTDHGGIGTSHGGNTFEEENIFYIASGDYIPNMEITKQGDEDYSNTPKLVDVAVTALHHLCIPVQAEWNLDGEAVGIACNNIFVGHSEPFIQEEIHFFPNPISQNGQLYIENLPSEAHTLQIRNITGRLVAQKQLTKGENAYILPQNITTGWYLLDLLQDNHLINRGKIFVID